jgi:hypothetical protein
LNHLPRVATVFETVTDFGINMALQGSSFLFRAVVRSQFANISSWLCSAHPAEALAQLLCEKSRLLEGGEMVALL